jgi:hypothetical protein
VCRQGERIAGWEQLSGHVPERDHADRAVEFGCDDRRVDDLGQALDEPTLPQADVPHPGIAGRPQQPVVTRILVLQDVALAVDDDTFEPGTGLGGLGVPGLSAVGPVEQLVERGRFRVCSRSAPAIRRGPRRARTPVRYGDVQSHLRVQRVAVGHGRSLDRPKLPDDGIILFLLVDGDLLRREMPITLTRMQFHGRAVRVAAR